MTTDRLPPLDPIIHSRARQAIISVLIGVKQADLNLSIHLSKLEEAGYISLKKSFEGKKPHTTCSLTEKGKQAFVPYLKALEDYLPPRRKERKKE
ncbi:MAG: transcriptional regulator [Candidatus Aminicenantes bacterium]|nr:transcriptional regulator [Candidatus Aminicenantes bacterium]